MRRTALFVLTTFILVPSTREVALAGGANAQTRPTTSGILAKKWSATRSSPLDLELGGELKGLPVGATRYVTREQLLTLPQVAFTARNDEMFAGPTQVSGVPLDELARALGRELGSDLVIAVASDGYRSTFPSGYLRAHHPVLVLQVSGKDPAAWPKDAEHGNDIGPYTVAYDNFLPSFKIFAHADEQQIPWGVIRLEFRDEKTVYGAIAPRGPHTNDAAVQAGYRIAQQNCFRCHNAGREGGQKSGRPWLVLSAWATASPEFFTAYVRDPKTKNPSSAMPGNPKYDDSTMRALIAYFRTISAPTR